MQGHGYITEAVHRLTQLAFETLGFQRVEIRCEAANQRSAAVAVRAGYTLEAHLRNQRRNPLGELADTLIHAKIASDHDNG
jgi:RimJ/RimL family protein N-acetyltransferase